MNSLNDWHPAITRERKASTTPSVDLQQQLLTGLGEPMETRSTRPRKPLSKFTITAPNPPCHGGGGDAPCIPAYRTFSQVSLPKVSLEDVEQINIPSYTRLPRYSLPLPKSTISTSPSSNNHHRTKQLLLQKKTIHGSLEDLRNRRNHPDSVSSRKSRNVPTGSKESDFTKGSSQQTRNNKDNIPRISSTNKPATISPEKRINSEAQTDNIINTEEKAVHYDRGTEDNSPYTTLPSSSQQQNVVINDRHQHYECEHDHSSNSCVDNINLQSSENVAEENCEESQNENFTSLSLENRRLKKQILDERRKCIFYRIVSTFAFVALRRRSTRLDQVEIALEERRMECAARIVLHHLLLNSWRMAKGQVAAVTLENTQMHKTIDNQSLQLNIIRKMQSMEKEKTTSILLDYTDVKRNHNQIIKENETMKEEYAKVLEEKSSLQRHLRCLSDENSRLSTDLRLRLDKKDMQLKSMELDRLRAEKFSRENQQLARETEVARSQIKELTTQQANWQEKAMSVESQCFQLKLELESRESTYKKVLNEQRDVSKENEILSLSKLKLEKAVEEAQLKLGESMAMRKKLEKSYSDCREELEDLEDQVQYLQSALRQYKRENAEIRQKLYDCTLKNVQKRRVWGAALYFLVNPIEAFKRFYFGAPERPPHHRASQQTRTERLSVTVGDDGSNE